MIQMRDLHGLNEQLRSPTSPTETLRTLEDGQSQTLE